MDLYFIKVTHSSSLQHVVVHADEINDFTRGSYCVNCQYQGPYEWMWTMQKSLQLYLKSSIWERTAAIKSVAFTELSTFSIIYD